MPFNVDLDANALRAERKRLVQFHEFERSPYAKVLSLANWVENFQTCDATGQLPENPEALTGAVDRLISDGSLSRVRNIDRYRGLDGRVTVNPWRTETLSRDFADFCRSLGISRN